MTVEIQRADARWRRVVIGALTIGSCVACAAVFALHRYFAALYATAPSPQSLERMRHWISLSLTGSGLCMLALAACAAALARRTLAQQCWPPQPMHVIRDTRVRRGPAAARIARALDITACLLSAIAITTAVAGWMIFGAS